MFQIHTPLFQNRAQISQDTRAASRHNSRANMQRLTIVDSHTGGEPTRIVIAGGPDLGGGSLAGRRERFQRDFDRYRSAVVNEPRGSDVVVGALLVEPEDKSCACGVIFFNNVGYLGMCGHGTIGLVVTQAHLGKSTPGEHRIETPVMSNRVAIIGAGVIGLSCAYYCARRGFEVTVVDRKSAQRDGCSFGNAGMIVPSHFIPLAA